MLKFQDGSIANISYLANGDRSVPKGQFEVFCEGKVARLEDFRTLELARDGKTQRVIPSFLLFFRAGPHQPYEFGIVTWTWLECLLSRPFLFTAVVM